jgi:hypothetical protein
MTNEAIQSAHAPSMMHGGPATNRTGRDTLVFPKTLAGAWCVPDAPDRGTTLQHVHALDAVATFLTWFGHHAWRSMGSWESVLALFLAARADSQGRMDLIARVSSKVEDLVNLPSMSQARLSGTPSRLES